MGNKNFVWEIQTQYRHIIRLGMQFSKVKPDHSDTNRDYQENANIQGMYLQM